jgi:chemotaxis protein CheX
MYAGDADNLDYDLKKSAIAELSNMIVGNASSIFYKKGLKIYITTPTVLTSKKVSISNKYPIICIPLSFGEGGNMKLEINVSTIENENQENQENSGI